MLVNSCPECAEREREQQFLDGYAEEQHAGYRSQIPYLLDNAGVRQREEQEEQEVQAEEQQATHSDLPGEIWSAPNRGDAAAEHGYARGVNRIELGEEPEQQEDWHRCEHGEEMEAMRLLTMLPHLPMLHREQRLVQHGTDAADREAKNQAFDVKARSCREIEERRGSPVLRYEEWFGQPQWHGPEAHAEHLLARPRH